MKIVVTSVFVEDQYKALAFYTDVLGFEKKTDEPAGAARWLTVTSPGDSNGVELLLEPNGTDIAKDYQTRLREAGIPATMFGTDDIQAEHDRLTGLGVTFTQAPTSTGPVTSAVFDDTCGNLIMISQMN
ncbi:hypothetical protein ALI144C_23950 [Actinosynnema sp. ALI-1.44]|uniref:VOC family protein n=1 Tax=Actinosynnema sp. ALI-1.44 TaxID=1933779 RepID=UPI00097C351E|nr:VOC family protein [Actinosynnema sp. ALI-1.44]ONI79797.1 hypothetical protein ALI144C_23950 [Actinosynnema sp. ALI-1.44]